MKFPAMWSISDEQPYQRYICMHHIIILQFVENSGLEQSFVECIHVYPLLKFVCMRSSFPLFVCM